jgi:hypothetical protein
MARQPTEAGAARLLQTRPHARPLCTAASGKLSSSEGGSSGGGIFSQPESQLKARDKMAEKLEKGKGWREALDSGLYEQQRLKRLEGFKTTIEELAQAESFTLDSFEGRLKQGLDELENGMTRIQRARLFADKLSGGTTSDTLDAQKEDVRRKLRIIGELTPHERRMPKLLDRRARRDVAAKLGLTETHVDELLFEFQLQYAQWAFLRREHMRGRKLPENNDEFEAGMQRRPTREFVALMKGFEEKKRRLEQARNGDEEETPRPSAILS